MNRIIAGILLILSAQLGSAQIKVVTGKDTAYFADADEYTSKTGKSEKEGYWIYMAESGKKAQEGKFVAGKREGIWKKYYNNGVLKSEITYKSGDANGYAKMYYESGNLSEEGTWVEQKWVGDYKYYHENGNLSYDWKYDGSGKRTGVQKYYHENGNLMIEGSWDQGKESGVIKEYYENGSLKGEKSFKEGTVDTTSIRAYEMKAAVPQVKKSMDKFDGNGYYKSVNANNQVEYEGVWKGGKFMDGKRYYYNAAGEVVKEDVFRNGVKLGK